MRFLRTWRYRSLEGRVTPLIIGILILLPLYPILEGDRGDHSGLIVQFAFTALIALGVWAAAAGPWLLAVGVVLATPAAILNFVSLQSVEMEVLDAGFGFLFFLFATGAVTRAVVRGRINHHDLVKGGIAIYLLIGLTFMHVYRIIDTVDPNAFAFSQSQEQGGNWADYLYYSFVTLTTLGYGDIQPVARFAQSISITEAIIGPLFIAIFIAAVLHYRMQNPANGRDLRSETRSRRDGDD